MAGRSLSHGAAIALSLALLSVPRAARGQEAGPPLSRHQLGARVRGIFVTETMLSPFLPQATSLESGSFALEYVYRFPRFDVVTSLDMSFLPVKDGNYLARGNDPSLDTHYTQFRDLNFLSADVSIIAHHALTRWLELRYGAGLGLGVVLGDVLVTNNSPQVCNAQNAGDESSCYPISPTAGPIRTDQPDAEAKLRATETGETDTPLNPHRHVGAKPPVMGVLNLVFGLRFKVHKHVATTVELGFRNAVFFGAGVHYLF